MLELLCLLLDCHRYQLDVEATDGGIPRRIGVTQIAIQVVNVNDNSPRFDRSFYSEEVSEGMHNIVPMNCMQLLVYIFFYNRY